MKLLFITNFCPHYRIKTYQKFAQRANVQFAFFSGGNEWYWGQDHGAQTGRFPHINLRGVDLTRRLRITPGLIALLWKFEGDVVVKCINGRFALPATLLMSKIRRKPFVLWTGIWQHPRTLFHRLTYPITRLVYRLADGIVVYGDHVKRYLESIGVDGGKIFVAGHAVDNEVYSRQVSEEERSALQAKCGLDDRRILLFVGQLEEFKGLDVLLDAFARARPANTVLVLVGRGSLREHLVTRARELGIAEQVVVAGYVAPQETVALYAIADAFVFPSVSGRAGSECWGLVVNEAMNQGLPVITTTAVGAAQGGLVLHGVNGEVVAERDAVALSKAIQRVMGDPEYRERLGRGARAAIQPWDNARMIDGFMAAAEYALGRRARSHSGDDADGEALPL